MLEGFSINEYVDGEHICPVTKIDLAKVHNCVVNIAHTMMPPGYELEESTFYSVLIEGAERKFIFHTWITDKAFMTNVGDEYHISKLEINWSDGRKVCIPFSKGRLHSDTSRGRDLVIGEVVSMSEEESVFVNSDEGMPLDEFIDKYSPIEGEKLDQDLVSYARVMLATTIESTLDVSYDVAYEFTIGFVNKLIEQGKLSQSYVDSGACHMWALREFTNARS